MERDTAGDGNSSLFLADFKIAFKQQKLLSKQGLKIEFESCLATTYGTFFHQSRLDILDCLSIADGQGCRCHRHRRTGLSGKRCPGPRLTLSCQSRSLPVGHTDPQTRQSRPDSHCLRRTTRFCECSRTGRGNGTLSPDRLETTHCRPCCCSLSRLRHPGNRRRRRNAIS